MKVLFRRPCRRAYWRAALLVLLLAPLGSAAELPLKIQPVGEESPRGFSRTFSKRVDVFGIPVFATTGTPDAKVLHAANVLAQ